MRTLLPLLILCTAVAAAEPSLAPGVSFGTSALVAEQVAVGVIFSPDSQHVGLVEPQSVRYWNLKSASLSGRVKVDFKENQSKLSIGSDGLAIMGYSPEKPNKLYLQVLNGQPIAEMDLPMKPDVILLSEDLKYAALDIGHATVVIDVDSDEEMIRFPSAFLRRFSASADGKTFAICNRDGDVFAAAAGQGIWRLNAGPQRGFASVAVSTDGKRIAASSYFDDEANARKINGEVKVWTVADRQLVCRCEAVDWFGEFANRLRFSPDGKMLLAGDGAYLRGWTIPTGNKCFAAEPGWNYPGPVVVSPDSRHVAVSYGKRAIVWNLETGRMPDGFATHSGPVWDTVFSPDGRRAATASYGLSTVLVWDTATGKNLATLTAPFNGVVKPEPNGTKPFPGTSPVIPGRIAMQFHRDGSKLVTVNEASGAGGLIRVWDVNAGRLLWQYDSKQQFSPAVAFAASVLIVAESPKAKAFDVQSGTLVWTCCKPLQSVGVLANRRGDLAVLEEKDHAESLILKSATGEVIDSLEGIPQGFATDDSSVHAVLLGPEMTGSAFRDAVSLRDWKTKESRELGRMKMGSAKFHLSPDLELRYELLEDERPVEIREVDGDLKLSAIGWEKDLQKYSSRHTHFRFSPDHRLFAVINQEGSLAVWECFSGEVVIELETGCVSPHFLAFSPDGSRIFTSHGENGGGPVLGFDTISRTVTKDLDAPPLFARRAVLEIAKSPPEAVALAKQILSPASEDDLKRFDQWLKELDSQHFRDREAASEALTALGWRVRAKLQAALAGNLTAEARQRLEQILDRKDQKPLRAVQMMEILKTPEAEAVLKDVITRMPGSLVAREARRSLARMTAP